MLRPSARWAIIAATLLSLEVKDMSNRGVSFESARTGVTPEGWTATLTGSGNPRWTVESDETAPSKAKVVKQSGRATYPLLLKNDTNIEDGFIEIKFKAISGAEDRAAGGYGVTVPVPANTWHSLRIDFKGSRFTASFNGKQMFEVDDSTFTGAGKVGLWTKADSVTLFDDVKYDATR
jgi:hypothetical protein